MSVRTHALMVSRWQWFFVLLPRLGHLGLIGVLFDITRILPTARQALFGVLGFVFLNSVGLVMIVDYAFQDESLFGNPEVCSVSVPNLLAVTDVNARCRWNTFAVRLFALPSVYYSFSLTFSGSTGTRHAHGGSAHGASFPSASAPAVFTVNHDNVDVVTCLGFQDIFQATTRVLESCVPTLAPCICLGLHKSLSAHCVL